MRVKMIAILVGFIAAALATHAGALQAAPPSVGAEPSLASAMLRPGERPWEITDIAGVVAAGTQWQLVMTSFDTLDGVVGVTAGGILLAQEQTSTIRKLDKNHRETVYLRDTHGAGSLSLDAAGRLFGVQRTCTDPGLKLADGCKEPTAVVMLAPNGHLLANSFSDGRPLGRLNDLIADGAGGVFFTSQGVFHVTAAGLVTVVAEDIQANGVMLSRDARTLYATNADKVEAFDVAQGGATSRRRTFVSLRGDGGADGMAIDDEGRLYVTANSGVHVVAVDGSYLGLMPTPRRPIAVAFAGPSRRTLYVVQSGAVGPDGQAWVTPASVRNNAKSVYAISMIAQGFKGRPK